MPKQAYGEFAFSKMQALAIFAIGMQLAIDHNLFILLLVNIMQVIQMRGSGYCQTV